jgi:FeS assembly protein IscX
MKWTDAQQIAEALFEAHPDVKPLEVRFTDLHRWVCELEDFDDAPDKSSEGNLEAIQMAWLDEWED